MCLGFGIYFILFLNSSRAIRHFCFPNWLVAPWIQKVSGHLAGDFSVHAHTHRVLLSLHEGTWMGTEV